MTFSMGIAQSREWRRYSATQWACCAVVAASAARVEGHAEEGLAHLSPIQQEISRANPEAPQKGPSPLSSRRARLSQFPASECATFALPLRTVLDGASSSFLPDL